MQQTRRAASHVCTGSSCDSPDCLTCACRADCRPLQKKLAPKGKEKDAGKGKDGKKSSGGSKSKKVDAGDDGAGAGVSSPTRA